jgi:hypothetical protein
MLIMFILSGQEDTRIGILNVSFTMQTGVPVCAVVIDVSEGEGVLCWLGRVRVGRQERTRLEDNMFIVLLSRDRSCC